MVLMSYVGEFRTNLVVYHLSEVLSLQKMDFTNDGTQNFFQHLRMQHIRTLHTDIRGIRT